MRNMRILIGFSVLLVVLGSFTCKGSKDLTAAEVQAMLARFGDSPLKLKLSADESSIGIERAAGKSGRFQVTLKNPECSFSTGMYKEMMMEIPEVEIPVEMGELVLIYGPDEGYCAIRAVRDAVLTIDIMNFVPEEGREKLEKEKAPFQALVYSIQELTINDYDISALLDTQGESFFEAAIAMLSANPEIKAAGTKLGLEFTSQEGPNVFTWVMDRVESTTKASPELLSLFFTQDDVKGTIDRVLEKGKAFFDLDTRQEGIHVSISGSDANVAVDLDILALSYSGSPMADKEGFKFGFNWDLSGVEATGLKQEGLEALTKLERLNLGFSLEGLSPGFVEAYFDMLKTAMKLQAGGDPEAVQQEMGLVGMTLVSHLIGSKPIINLSLSPLEHAFGKVEAEGRFQLIRMGAPVGKATATISDLGELEKKLAALQIVPEDKLAELMTQLKQVFVAADGGPGTMTFEIKEDDTKNFYLNGKSHKLQ